MRRGTELISLCVPFMPLLDDERVVNYCMDIFSLMENTLFKQLQQNTMFRISSRGKSVAFIRPNTIPAGKIIEIGILSANIRRKICEKILI